MVRVSTLAILGAAGADAAAVSLRASLEVQAGGPGNCAYKCGLMWNQHQDWTATSFGSFHLYEYTACLKGCQLCNGGEPSPSSGVAEGHTCQSQCKMVNWPTYTYTWNAANVIKEFNTDALPSKRKLLSCVNGCLSSYKNQLEPTGYNGIDNNAHLPQPFLDCNIQCYDDNFTPVQQDSIAACRAAAQASCSATDQNCHTEDDCYFGIAKGVIEADKACIQGCSQNLCQDGAQCYGKGYFNKDYLNRTGCQLITSQTVGVRNTINKGYYGSQSDLGDCCNAAVTRCGFAPGYARKDFGEALGQVIQTDQQGCMKPDGSVFGILQKQKPYECKCNEFFKVCDGLLNDVDLDTFVCYGIDGPRMRSGPVPATV